MIRHIPTGLYKASGHNGKFNKTGKIWRGAMVKNHLRMFSQYRRDLSESINNAWGNFPLDECEIIEFSIMPEDKQNLLEFVTDEMR